MMIEDRAGLEIDLWKPEPSVDFRCLIFDNGCRVRVVPALEIGIAEQLPAVPEILEIGICRRADARPAADERTSLDVDRIGDEIDLRAGGEKCFSPAFRPI